MSLHNHNTKIINFSNDEIVTYPLIKLIGLIENVENTVCQPDKIIRLKLNHHPYNQTGIINKKFKLLVELKAGDNHLDLIFCCETIKLTLKYFPRQTQYTVVPVYIICFGHDGRFQAPPEEDNSIESACRRITVGARLLQCITAEKLYEYNLGRKTFHLENCRVFQSSLNYSQARVMTQQELWEFFGREIMSTIGCETKKYLAFLSCTKYCGEKYGDLLKTHEELVNITEGYVALGGGGLALFGTACLYTWPESFPEILGRFDSSLMVDRRRFLDDSCYRGTRGGCFSTTLGSVLHELFHTFDLGHTQTGIMGRGFDNIFKVFKVNDDISKTFHSNIEFKEEFVPEMLSERLEKEHKKKEFNVLPKFDESDDTHLNKSCAVLLSYHKWFNNELKDAKSLTFDLTNNFIKSTNGIRVVQIRDTINEMVLLNWTFEGKILKYSFQVAEEDLRSSGYKNVILVAEDTRGNLIKQNLQF